MIPRLIRDLTAGSRAALQSLRRRPASPEQTEFWRNWYFETGIAYYVAARAVYFNGTHPVSGNLFHHSIEMLLKGYLCDALDEWGRRRFGHDLWRLWRRLKQVAKDPTLTQFDETIRRVNRFERLRYPEGLRSYTFQFALRGPFVPSTGPYAPPRHRQFELAVNDVDELVEALLNKCRVNPRVFVARSGQEALNILRRDNPTGIW